ncbi:MAG: DUF6035 family protein [Thiobacillus sp.]
MQQFQQTIKLAIDCETGELVSAESLLRLDEADFSALRRESLKARVERKRGGSAVRFQCAICKQPVYLSRYTAGSGNRWFVHDGKSEHCPWHEGNRTTPEQTKALIYLGQQEGATHKELKRFLAQWLEADPLASGVNQEQTTFSQVIKGEWRRPDVKCVYQGHPVVFEIQLSYTFLSDVIERDEFYKRDGIHIIWVFASPNLNRAVVADEAFFNRRNLFVLDTDAMGQSAERGMLTFSGYRQTPHLVDDSITDEWTSSYVPLNEVIFPPDTFRPYFFDYAAARDALMSELAEARRSKEDAAWHRKVNEYLELALRYYGSDHSEDAKQAMLSKVDELYQWPQWHRGFEVLRDSAFYGWHGVLSVLLSIKLGRPVSYNPTLGVFGVIEAALRAGHQTGRPGAFAIVYLWAYKAYKSSVADKKPKWLPKKARDIKMSIERGETTWQRHTGYDEAIGLLFPELEEPLSTSFGCGVVIER